MNNKEAQDFLKQYPEDMPMEIILEYGIVKELIQQYCIASGLEFVEGICDIGTLTRIPGTEPAIKKDGGWRASILHNGVEKVYGFSPIHDEELTEENKEGAVRSLLYAMISKSVQ